MGELLMDFFVEVLPTIDQLTALGSVIAWPCVVLVLAVIFRKPVTALFPSVENIKYKDFETVFRQRLGELKEVVEDSGNELSTIEDDETEIHELAKSSPSTLIMNSWSNIELAARKKVKAILPPETTPVDPLDRPLDYLESSGSLTPRHRQNRACRYHLQRE